ncbi:MAG: ComEC family competence protein [Chloroflexaceae bacterium]|jgi:competence protein ComEC|nr:ComEC family competence protein [Chloroflexaceae bacterium]
MVLIYLVIAWVVGLLAADLLQLPAETAGLVGFVGLVLAACGWRWPALRLMGLCLLCCGMGSVRYSMAQPTTTPQSVWLLAGQGEVTLQGFIAADPQRNDEGQQVLLQVEAARVGETAQPREGLVLLNLPPYPAYRYGQRLLVTGELRQPRAAQRIGEFDYRTYLARKRIFALMREPTVQLLPGRMGNPLLLRLADYRDHCRALLLRMLPEPHASLAVGILLGLQSSVPDDVYGDFSATGTSHILVVSGWNFTIVAAMLAAMASRLRLGRGATFWLSLAVMWTYALFVGASAAVLRAAAMASLVLLATASERRSHPWTLLAAAVGLLTMHDPQALWDLGFQLSTLATASLFAFAEPIGARLKRLSFFNWPGLGWASETLTATLAAQVLVLPLIMFHFSRLSIVAPLANLLLVPVVPFAMLAGAIALVGGLLHLELGQWLALGVWLPLAWLSEGVRLLAGLPWAEVRVPIFSIWILLAYYAIISGWYIWQATQVEEDAQPAPASPLQSHGDALS